MPLAVSYGVGVDSTALLVAMHQRGMRPDLILFADTGGEKPETYAYLPVIQEWLPRVGFPELTIVRYVPTRAPYNNLEEKCLCNETLPSLAFGHHSCAIVFKHEPMNKYIAQWQPAIDAWAAGEKVVRAIGYDDGPRDHKRREKADRACAKKEVAGDKDATRYEYRYYLQEWHIDREACDPVILSAGLPVPPKSSCWYCPAMKKSEIVWLRDNHPELFERALAMERGARDGRHGLTSIKGLGRGFAWADLATVPTDQVVDDAKEQLRP